MSTTMTERVQKGAGLLDQALPGWESAIDLDSLNLYSNSQCVLGQVFGTWEEALTTLGWSKYKGEVVDHGFQETGGAGDFPALTAEWKEFIGSRLTVLEGAYV